ncbi:DEAD/DEAH box helicase family protein [Skermanella pratensis]|uniref:DEAD/DEAH box helicase family protein n=1 Tax=Skermanella pratensis TaxID=2233999 RepID=UPI001300D066|nr:DEAD/DEAH box helicase family protein [Skermanella pratensis]
MPPRAKTARTASAAASLVPFSHKLVLNRLMLEMLGFRRFRDISERLALAEEGATEDNVSRLHHALVAALPGKAVLDAGTLLAYDRNIVRHTAAIHGRRERPVTWKYFQYLALLFTEIYLDNYLKNPDGWLTVLNRYLDVFNRGVGAGDRLSPWTADDLRKLAFWNATGSGKTLLMHVNILQFRHYLDRHNRSRDFNRVILVTPNEGLSRQHLQEFRLSRMEADLFTKDGASLFTGKAIEIIEIGKLREDGKEKTVSVDAFESNNLVLVDEGHQGAGGDQWREMRRRLAADGFTFEYSATFGQAVKSATGTRQRDLTDEYGKAILFDYSYRFFYEDGYGKDFRVLNLADDRNEETRTLYLTACLLAFYQQAKVYGEQRVALKPFLIERPLWIFVGGSVNAVRTQQGRKVSDVVDILLFLARFVSDRDKATNIRRIGRLISGSPGLLDATGREVFANAFPFLADHLFTPEAVYQDVLRVVFNAERQASLHVEELKGSDGELALRLGDYDPFGVINVGDAAQLAKLCREHPELTVEDRPFTGSLFQGLNNQDTTVNLLIGSRKFTEGWSSWRVSTLGLMNFAKGEGPGAIQLFGRGVRLKGFDHGLKRHTAPGMGLPYNAYLGTLETLNIFGIRADYMKQFQEYLAAEGVGEGEEPFEILLPVVAKLPEKPLKLIGLPAGIDFKRDPRAAHPRLGPPPAGFLPRNRVSLNWYPRLQAERSRGLSEVERNGDLRTGVLTGDHLALLDVEALYFELQQFKAERSWFNFDMAAADILPLLENPNWYTLYIPPDRLAFDQMERVHEWQEIAGTLLKLYCERLYGFRKAEFEAPFVELRTLQPDDPNFLVAHKIIVDRTETALISMLRQTREAIDRGVLRDVEMGVLGTVCFDRHLYQPLLYAGAVVQVQPVPLNEGERDFVTDLREYHRTHPKEFADAELYLLRNRSRGRGVSFLIADNFYPDFILWLVTRNTQYVSFIDPKGIRNLRGETDPKIQLYQRIKVLERHLGDPSVVLNSFILSTTAIEDVDWWAGGTALADLEQKNVIFQSKADIGYIGKLIEKITVPQHAP